MSRILIIVAAMLVMLGARNLAAETQQKEEWYYPYEIAELKIKLSKDGHGIIYDVSCEKCDYTFVKITPQTKVIVNNRETDLLYARTRAGKNAYIKFDTETAEVKYIFWAE